ncbi:hypothetical protein [Auritidibacter ignavus]|uniref:hypothetical protein n=1 Tax=Auritidibacter ignavus TaxID=678932 RepID=UPI0024B94C06|nr:hypothetical protein [Auritidibacter ignavus]WHS27282.1 hypothetical protein QM395_07760 [Auritidibacter ignavus]
MESLQTRRHRGDTATPELNVGQHREGVTVTPETPVATRDYLKELSDEAVSLRRWLNGH